MATFRKRGSTWRVEVCKNGIRSSATFDNKTQAKEWASQTEARILEYKSHPVRYDKKLRDAFDRYAEDVSPQKKGERWEKIRLNLLKCYPLADVNLSELSSTHVALWRDQRLTEVAGSSVNRELNLISSVLTIARLEWRWITQIQFQTLKDLKILTQLRHCPSCIT